MKKAACGGRLYYLLLVFAITAGSYAVYTYYNILKNKVYSLEDFGIQRIYSKNDYNNNGIDDYTDILLGARKDAENAPVYRSAYYAGGYPPEDEGVCTDTVWRAFLNAGYILRDLVDADVVINCDLYPNVNGTPDKNIDFRRVKNLKVFFDRYAESYTLDPYDIHQWQPGDIVIFGYDYCHIGIISDKRNKDGVAFLIHNSGQPLREENALIRWHNLHTITGHYRFENIPELLK